MALHFSANQYQKEFYPKRLQNWEVPKLHRDCPRALDGFTQIIANDRGHLFPGVPRSRYSPWGNFVGTWDMPKRIPGTRSANPTARSAHAREELIRVKMEGDSILSGPAPVIRKSTSKSQTQVNGDVTIQELVNSQRSGGKAPSPAGSVKDLPQLGGDETNRSVHSAPSVTGSQRFVNRYSPILEPVNPSHIGRYSAMSMRSKSASPVANPISSPIASIRHTPSPRQSPIQVVQHLSPVNIYHSSTSPVAEETTRIRTPILEPQ